MGFSDFSSDSRHYRFVFMLGALHVGASKADICPPAILEKIRIERKELYKF
jgi:hypothetical protein